MRLKIYSKEIQLFFLWLLLLVIIDPRGDFPINDDWVYAYPVKSLLEHGRFEFLSPFAANLLLQVLWGYLFCLPDHFSFTSLRISTLVLGFTALISTYRLLKEGIKDKFIISLGVLLVLLNPLFLPLAYSFMTDIPFLAFILAGIFFYIRFYETLHTRDFWLSFLLFFCAYLIRQPAILIFGMLSALLIFYRREETSRKTVICGMALYLFLAAFHELFLSRWLGFSAASANLGNAFIRGIIYSPSTAIVLTARHLFKSLLYLGFLSIPFQPLIFKGIRNYLRHRVMVVSAIIAVTVSSLTLCVITDKYFPFGGNILMNVGIGPLLLYDVETLQMGSPLQLPIFFTILITLFSLLSFVGSMVHLWVTFKNSHNFFLKLQFMVFFTVLLYMIPLLYPVFFDRYLLLPSITLTILLCYSLQDSEIGRIPKIASLLLVSCFGWFTITATHDYMEFNRARNGAFQYLREQSIPLEKIDAGLEYNGWYAYGGNSQAKPGKSAWWITDDEYKITLRQLDNHHVIKKFSFNRWLNLSRGDVFILRFVKPAAPDPLTLSAH